MSKEIYISSTPHETRLAIVENDALTEMYYERENEYTLAGSIYNGRVTRVLPGMQSSFVDIGLERDAFLYITDFMEEAGDAADFEASANGGDHRQSAPRTIEASSGGSGRDRGDRDRGGRDRGRNGSDRGEAQRATEVRPAPEPTDAEVFEQAVSGLGVVRTGESDRSGNRRGGRNRRGGGDRGQDRGTSQESMPRRERVEVPVTAETTSAPVVGEPAGEIGEGAPGADGSRRWRGRRGRRGNRGNREQGMRPVAGDAAAVEPVSAYGAEELEYPVEQAFEAEESEVIAAYEPAAPEVVTAPVPELRARGDRDDRGRRPERGDESRRTTGPVYGAYPDAEAASGAPIEPIILPGESLSKYRAGSASDATVAAPEAAAAPAPEFVLPGSWDGGLVLPGETLRPRSVAPDAGRGRGYEARGERDRGGRGERDRGGRDRDGRGERPQPARFERAPVAAPAAAPLPETVEFVPAVDLSPLAEIAPVVHSTFVAPPPMPVIPAAEYEPTDAAVSFRIDPVAPREFRQAAPPAEPEAVEHAPHEEAPAIVGATPPAEFVEPAFEAPIIDEETVPVAPVHEVTSLDAGGAMHAEAYLSSVPVEVAGQQHVVEEATPEPEILYHHGALETHSAVESNEAEPDEMVSAVDLTGIEEDGPVEPAHPLHFEPGQGHLEEEVIDEDEDGGELLAVRASAYDGDEQETLEHAADLGTMLREMSIDEITRVEPDDLDEDDEDDDFEEDFLEEDLATDHMEEGEEDTEEEFSEEGEQPQSFAEDSGEPAVGSEGQVVRTDERPRRDEGRGRRDGRRGDRGRRSGGSGEQTASGGERSRGDRGRREGHGGGRQSMQSTNLPAISELLKPGQEILCQIAKEPIAKKGARITSHIALPGRFLVFMPTVSHTGVSRKIESDGERRRLKEILLSEKGDAAGGFIVRTAAAGASEEELRSDLRFLLNLWADIKQRSESSKSPALIYHDLNLVERVLRDQVTDNFSAIWVDTESEYERVLRFLQRFQPSLIRRVKLYTKETPLFEQFGITEEINKALRSKVWLKSGGSIVINQTEALVAIDINTGKFVGKTARLEDTIVKTNLDAIPEIVRQIRLRDLGGIIIIDFIDMDERKNRNKVMAALEEELKSDRAPSKVLQFNDFGLVAITRKRVKQSLERTLSTTCSVCAGTGMVKSPVTVCNDIYIEMRKMAKHLDRGDVMLRVNPEVVKQLKSGTSKWLQEMEEMVGKTILVKSDPSLHPEQFDIH
jgi:ribonuclease G